MIISSGLRTAGSPPSQAPRSSIDRRETAMMVCPSTVTARLSSAGACRRSRDRLGDQEFLQPVAVVGLVDVFVDVFGVAAQETGGDAFRTAPGGRWLRLDTWTVTAKGGLSTPKNKQIRCGGV